MQFLARYLFVEAILVKKILLPIIICFLIFIFYNNVIPIFNTKDTSAVSHNFTSNNKKTTINTERNFLLKHNNTQYFWKREKHDCVLYALDDNETFEKKLAVFPPFSIYDIYTDKDIIQFGICGDWLILSVGNYQGTARYFYGDFVRLKKDGSELSHFKVTDDGNFVIVDDWIYYNYFPRGEIPTNDPYGCYRIRPDGTEKEFLGNIINKIYLYAEDGYVYGNQKTEEIINRWNPVIDLIRCKPDTSDVVTLFKGTTLPKINNSEHMGYRDIKINSALISFKVFVLGYKGSHKYYMYLAEYHVNLDGSNLILINEKYTE